MKLALKLTLPLSACVFLVLGALAYSRVQREVALFNVHIRRDQALAARSVALAAKEVWRKEGGEAALKMLEKLEQSEAANLNWLSLEAIPLKHDIPAEQLAKLVRGEEVVLREEAKNRISTLVPIVGEGIAPVAVVVSQTLSEQQDFTRTTLLISLLAVLVLGCAFAALNVVLGAWLVGRPISLLAAKARQVGAGNLGQPLEVSTGDELGALAEEMNRMAEQLVAAREGLDSETRARISMLEQLRHADRLTTVGKLASGVAHEVGTPLNVIAARAKMIASGMKLEATADNARIIAQQAESITRIIRQLLDFARRRAPQKRTEELSSLVEHTLALLKPFAQKHGIDTRMEEQSESLRADVDRGQIQQAITNLVMNGLQAMSEGGELVIGVQRARMTPPSDVGGPEAEFARIWVRDQGPGIPEDVHSRIFEPFFTTKDVGDGTGLGLSVSYGLVREHGGWIAVESQPGQGSCFSIYLPFGGYT